MCVSISANTGKPYDCAAIYIKAQLEVMKNHHRTIKLFVRIIFKSAPPLHTFEGFFCCCLPDFGRTFEDTF